MKKAVTRLLALALVVCALLTFASCGNMQIIDTTYSFDYAIVKFPDGTVKTIEIQSWMDYEGEQLQIVAKDGTVYLFNSVNCILVSEP